MYVLKDTKNMPMTMKESIIVFLNIDDADFFKNCLNETMRIEHVSYLPEKSIVCKMELIKHE